jgi:hypothetical protein
MEMEIDGFPFQITSNVSRRPIQQMLALANEKIELARQIQDTSRTDVSLSESQHKEKYLSYRIVKTTAYFDALCHFHEIAQQILEQGKENGFIPLFDNGKGLNQMMTPYLMNYLEAAQEVMGHGWLFSDEKELSELIEKKNPELSMAYSESLLEMLSFMNIRLVNNDDNFNHEIMVLYYIQKAFSQMMEIYGHWNLKPSDPFYAQRIYDAKKLVRAEVLMGTDYCKIRPFLSQIENWLDTLSTHFDEVEDRAALRIEDQNSLNLATRASIELGGYSDYILMEEGENHHPECQEVSFDISRFPALSRLCGGTLQRNLQDSDAIRSHIITDLQKTIKNNPDLREP